MLDHQDHLPIDEDYYRGLRPEMLAYVPRDAAVVLDVGCGEGVFAARVKAERGAEVWGIELDQEAAACASERLDRVLTGDVMCLVDDLPDHHFDCIMFNDVLEHLVDPEGLLSKVKAKLSDHGCVMCSIPNVRHLLLLKELLLEKQWEYKNYGTLDRTHLRFFTKRSIESMFDRLDYDLLTIEGINPMTTWKFTVVNLLTLGFLSDTRYLEFACVARPR